MQIAYFLYDGFTALDITGPLDTLGGVPGHEPVFVAEQAGPVCNESRTLQMVAAKSIDEVPSPDIIVIPGGFGTRAVLDSEPLLNWLRTAHETSTWTTSVCTGSLRARRCRAARRPRGHHATGWPVTTLAELGAVPVPDRIVEHDRIMMAAGVSSGIDMGLRLIQKMYGDELAQVIQLSIEYDPEPPFDMGSPEKAPAAIVDVVRAGFLQQEADFAPQAAA